MTDLEMEELIKQQATKNWLQFLGFLGGIVLFIVGYAFAIDIIQRSILNILKG